MLVCPTESKLAGLTAFPANSTHLFLERILCGLLGLFLPKQAETYSFRVCEGKACSGPPLPPPGSSPAPCNSCGSFPSCWSHLLFKDPQLFFFSPPHPSFSCLHLLYTCNHLKAGRAQMGTEVPEGASGRCGTWLGTSGERPCLVWSLRT